MSRKAGREKLCLGVSFPQGLFKQRSSLSPYHPHVKGLGMEMVTGLNWNISN